MQRCKTWAGKISEAFELILIDDLMRFLLVEEETVLSVTVRPSFFMFLDRLRGK